MRMPSALAIRQGVLVIALGLLTLLAIVAVNITARNDPTTAWFGSAVVTVLLLTLGILGLIATPQDTLSIWTRLSRGLILWSSNNTTRTVGCIAGVVTVAAGIWQLGPASVHEVLVHCDQDTQIRYRVWDGSQTLADCKRAVAVTLWRPFLADAAIPRLIACRSSAAVWPTPVPISGTNEVRCPSTALPNVDSSELFDVFSHDRKLDLSRWQYVPPEKSQLKLSPAAWTDRMKVRRRSERATSFCIRHASTGQPTPDFSSPTHDVNVTETTERPINGPQPKLRIFDVCVNVAGEPIDNWFDVQLDVTYWNAFNNVEGAWAGLPLPHGAQNAIFAIQFPPNKAPTIWERREGSRDTKESQLVTDDSVKGSPNHAYIKWTIQHPQKNWVYKIDWKW
jgi:hypothetical protein